MCNKASIRIRVKLYATLAKYASASIMHEPIEVEISDNATLTDLYDRLGIPRDEVKTSFVNSVMQSPEYRLSEGDQVGIFPPVGGGSGGDEHLAEFRLTASAHGARGGSVEASSRQWSVKGEPLVSLCRSGKS
jgi:molybdopterin converting factor small subunit